MAPHRFELVGGDPALDFLNTIHDWTEEPHLDYLTTFGDAVRWGEAAGVLSRGEARRLAGREDRAELERLAELRSVLQRVTSALIDGRAPRAEDLEALAEESAESANVMRLEGAGVGLRRAVRSEDAGTATLRHRIVNAAMALLTAESAERMRSCPACGWFFVDATKNRSRRWCSMSTCGASAKSRRYYQRTKARRSRKR
jgi:predicted RNA-binding Zn ribbon-like protein